jgi:hypothetical protein
MWVLLKLPRIGGPLGNGEVGLQSRASKFQTNHGDNGNRFLCAVGGMGLRGIQRAVAEQRPQLQPRSIAVQR